MARKPEVIEPVVEEAPPEETPVEEAPPVRKTRKKKAPEPPKITLMAIERYHNGAIAGGVGVHWAMGEKRLVTFGQYKQIEADVGTMSQVFERVE